MRGAEVRQGDRVIAPDGEEPGVPGIADPQRELRHGGGVLLAVEGANRGVARVREGEDVCQRDAVLDVVGLDILRLDTDRPRAEPRAGAIGHSAIEGRAVDRPVHRPLPRRRRVEHGKPAEGRHARPARRPPRVRERRPRFGPIGFLFRNALVSFAVCSFGHAAWECTRACGPEVDWKVSPRLRPPAPPPFLPSHPTPPRRHPLTAPHGGKPFGKSTPPQHPIGLVGVVYHQRLTGSYGLLRALEPHAQHASPPGGCRRLVLSGEADLGGDDLGVVAALHERPRPSRESGFEFAGVEEPVCFADDARLGRQPLAGADGHGVRSGVFADDIDRVAEGDAHAAALPDGEVVVPRVPTDLPALGINDRPLARQGRSAAFDERGVVVVGDEADFLRIGLVEDGQAEAPGEVAHRGFLMLSDREQHPCEAFAGGAEEDIGLVLAPIDAPHQPVLGGPGAVDAGVVSAGDEVGVDAAGVLMEGAELEPVVAADAGIGGAARRVLVGEVVDDPGEVLLEVADVEGDPQFGGDEPGVGGVVDGAAALVSDPDCSRIARRGGARIGRRRVEALTG